MSNASPPRRLAGNRAIDLERFVDLSANAAVAERVDAVLPSHMIVAVDADLELRVQKVTYDFWKCERDRP